MMRQQQTSVNPLILNFLQPKQMEVISENETKIVYDPENHISMFFGGGNSRGTTSIRNARVTRVSTGHRSFMNKNDGDVVTDD